MHPATMFEQDSVGVENFLSTVRSVAYTGNSVRNTTGDPTRVPAKILERITKQQESIEEMRQLREN